MKAETVKEMDKVDWLYQTYGASNESLLSLTTHKLFEVLRKGVA